MMQSKNKAKNIFRSVAVTIILISLFIILTEENLSEMSTLKSAYLAFVAFISVCICIYCGILTLFSFISGWRILCLLNPAPEEVSSDIAVFYSQSLVMGYMQYSRSVKIGFIDSGIIFSQSPFFSFMHKPFMIHYDNLENFRKISSVDSDLEFKVKGIKMRLTGESSDALYRKKMFPASPIASFKAGMDDTDQSIKRGEQRIITKKCRFDDLQPLFVSAVRDYLKSVKTGNIKSLSMHCFETTIMKKGYISGTVYRYYTDLVITSDLLFWGICDGDGCSTGCSKISDIASNIDSEIILRSNPLKVNGINISGFHYDESHSETSTINIGYDNHGNSFRNELADAVKKYTRKTQ